MKLTSIVYAVTLIVVSIRVFQLIHCILPSYYSYHYCFLREDGITYSYIICIYITLRGRHLPGKRINVKAVKNCTQMANYETEA